MDRKTIEYLKQTISQIVLHLVVALNSMGSSEQEEMKNKIKKWLKLTKEICMESETFTQEELATLEKLFEETDWRRE